MAGPSKGGSASGSRLGDGKQEPHAAATGHSGNGHLSQFTTSVEIGTAWLITISHYEFQTASANWSVMGHLSGADSPFIVNIFAWPGKHEFLHRARVGSCKVCIRLPARDCGGDESIVGRRANQARNQIWWRFAGLKSVIAHGSFCIEGRHRWTDFS